VLGRDFKGAWDSRETGWRDAGMERSEAKLGMDKVGLGIRGKVWVVV